MLCMRQDPAAQQALLFSESDGTGELSDPSRDVLTPRRGGAALANGQKGHAMETYPFNALLGRMKYITRWSLMRNGRPESLSEHTADTALIAHTLCLIAQRCTGTGAGLRPDTVATAALYHDAPEILTGDMPTPVKYKNDALRNAYKAVEAQSAHTIASLLPEELADIGEIYLTGTVLNDAERKLLKAADRLSALIKCLEECQAGNREFEAALAQQRQALEEMHSPEADYFIEHMLPCYTQNLDELTRGRF